MIGKAVATRRHQQQQSTQNELVVGCASQPALTFTFSTFCVLFASTDLSEWRRTQMNRRRKNKGDHRANKRVECCCVVLWLCAVASLLFLRPLALPRQDSPGAAPIEAERERGEETKKAGQTKAHEQRTVTETKRRRHREKGSRVRNMKKDASFGRERLCAVCSLATVNGM